MSHFPSDNPRSWLDEALRDVPLPVDLIARLRRLGVDNDDELGEALRRVPLPDQLAAQLKQIPDDVELDQRINRVRVRADFLAGLKEIPRSRDAGHEPDLEPVTADDRRDRRTEDRQPMPAARGSSASVAADRMTRWIVAASLMGVVTLAVLGYVADLGPVAQNWGPGQVEDARWTVLHDARDTSPTAPVGGNFRPLAQSQAELPEPPQSLERHSDRLPSEIVGRHTSVLADAEGLAADPLKDAPLWAMEQLTMPDSVRGPRPMELLLLDGADGEIAPMAHGFDWASLLRNGAFPFVSPSDRPQLATLRLPLVTRTAGYRSFHELLADGGPIDPRDVRTEDLLASIEYGFPLPDEGAVALYASGGPSPWDSIERKLLLLGVQAGGHEPRARVPVDVTFVVDASLTAPGLDALAVCGEALARTLEALVPEDRVSVILAAQRPISLAQGLGPSAGEELLEAVEQLARVEPQPIVDIVPAMEGALRHSGGGDGKRRLVVCVTSDLAYLGRTDEEELSRIVAARAAEGVRLDVVRISRLGRPDEVSTRLARAGGGAVHAATGRRELWAAFYQLLSGHSPLVARDVSLTLQFDPKIVDSYRVLGHETRAVGPAGEGTDGTVDLLLQDTSVVMLELKLRHSAAGEVATAHLEWQDPRTGEREAIVQRVGSAQFATTLGEAALPVQRATIAAMTAEILRRIPAVPADATLQDVVDEADAVDSRLWDEAWLVELVDAITTTLSQQGPPRHRGTSRQSGL